MSQVNSCIFLKFIHIQATGIGQRLHGGIVAVDADTEKSDD